MFKLWLVLVVLSISWISIRFWTLDLQTPDTSVLEIPQIQEWPPTPHFQTTSPELISKQEDLLKQVNTVQP